MTQQDRVQLDRGKIVSAALTLLDEVGLDRLSTRMLADRLQVRSPALYWHFVNKRDLLDAMAEAMLVASPRPEPPRPGDDVAQSLVERARTFRQALLSYRDGARMHAGTRPQGWQLPSLQAQAVVLIEAGMSAEDAQRAVLAVSRYTIGWVLEEQAEAERPPESGGGFALTDFPTLQAGRAVFERRNADENFDFGLMALVNGLTGRASSGDAPS